MGAKKDIGQLISKKLDGQKIAPKDEVWTTISSVLRKNRRRRFFVMLLVGIFLIGLIPLTKSIFFSNDEHSTEIKNTQIVTQDSAVDSLNSTTKIISNQKNQITDNQNQSSYNNTTTNSQSKTKDKYNLILKQKNDHSVSKNRISERIAISDKIDEPKKEESSSSTLDFLESNSELVEKELITSKANSKTVEKNIKDHQLQSQDNLKRRKWLLSAHFSIDNFGAFNQNLSNNTNTNFGVKAIFNATDDFAIRLGLNYLDLKYEYESLGSKINERLTFYEVPLDFKYKIFDKKVDINVASGISYYFLSRFEINQTGNLFFEPGSNFSINVSIPIETKLFKNTSFFIEPHFKYLFAPVENSIDMRTYMLGIKSGIIYQF